jgi:formylglycine-generating enzyme required for sulfatase activity/prolipoprotein diacylglyceryltransferase
MHPVLTVLHFGSYALPVFSYGLFFCVGLAAAAASVLGAARAERADAGACIAALGLALAGGMLGAWALNAAVQSVRLGSLSAGLAQPGIAFFGGAFGAAAAFVAACRQTGLPVAAIADRAVAGLAVAHGLGRTGCFLGGCCFGRPWDGPFAVHYLDPLAPAAVLSVGRHPTPLYEALGLSMIAVACAIRPPRSPGSGRRALGALAAYCALRFCVEFTRGDDARGVFFGGALSTSQSIAILVLLGCAVYTRRSMRSLAASAVLVLCLGAALRAGAERPAPPNLNQVEVERYAPLNLNLVEVERYAPLNLNLVEVVAIGSGWFSMGSDDADVAFAVDLCAEQAQGRSLCRPELFADEQPRHRVFVEAMRIDRTEVSQADYRRCVQHGACPPPRIAELDPRVSQPDQPATGVTWEEASRYCAWVGGRLPTEAEWERAARGNSARRFPWGRFWNSRIANLGGDGQPDAHDGYDYAAPVTALPDGRSAYGLLNMAGNAWELTADRYDREAYAKAAHVEARGDAKPEVTTDERVMRGGSWRAPAYMGRVTQRAAIKPDESRPDVGFRCAYNVR